MTSPRAMVDREAKARACEQAIQSRTFSRSEQLVQFLRYICDLELDGRGSEITEYSIATNALNRPPNYSPGEDSSVRSRAHALRRKLQEYYQTEAPDAEIRIDLPKGSYRPVFLAPNVTPHQTVQVRAIEPRRNPLPWILAAGVAVAALGAGLLLWERHPDPIDPLVRAAWGPVLRPGSDVLVLISAPPLIRLIPSQPGIKPQQGVIIEPAPDWAADWYRGQQLEDRGGPMFLAPTRGYAVFSDSMAALTASSLIGAGGASYHVMPEHAVQPRAIHENGLVVIGAPSYTPYLGRILKTTPYSIWFDPSLNEEVLGMRGASGHIYSAKRDPLTHRYAAVYGLITVLPGQPGHPRPERTLIFSGFSGSPGAQAAIDYFRSPASLRDLDHRFRQQGYSTFPPAYQVVVRCGVDTETAINAIYETHVVIASVPFIE